ncbi:MAG: iron-containing alcohol dehydrogenase [Spirochaetales bacterium]|nr:iron-containing alcohol dehydrogenase [Spirochaetales bacterium]
MARELHFDFRIPTNIVFGVGSLDTIGVHAKHAGLEKPLLVTDSVVGKSAGVKRALDLLAKEGIKPVVWDEINSEPTDKTIVNGLGIYRAKGCRGFIGFGGGSSMDTAKNIGILAEAGDDDPTAYMRGGGKTPVGCPPLIAVPTSAGTGSEVTSVGVFTSTATGHKMGVKHPSMFAKVAICDPSLMVSMPPAVTLATGIDALSHATECFTREREHPFCDTLALQAIKLIADNLKTAVKNGSDIKAREGMALAATMAGTAFEIGGLQFHSFAQAIGAKYHAPHGTTCGVALRGGLRYILPKATAKLARLCWAFGIDTTGMSEPEAAARGVEAATAFITDVGIGGVTKATGATREDIPWLAKETVETSAVPWSMEDATGLWEEIFRD